MKRVATITLMCLLALALDWAPWTPPFPLHGAAQVKAQAPYPPNQWHPYRGGTNCVQVSDVNGNFNCSPLVTINPATGQFNAALGGPISTAITLVIGPSGSSPITALSSDLVIAKASTFSAPAGPGAGYLTLRVRPSPRIPGYCTLVAIAGGAFGVEFPVAFVNPNLPLSGPSVGSNIFDYVILDLPGGPGGC